MTHDMGIKRVKTSLQKIAHGPLNLEGKLGCLNLSTKLSQSASIFIVQLKNYGGDATALCSNLPGVIELYIISHTYSTSRC